MAAGQPAPPPARRRCAHGGLVPFPLLGADYWQRQVEILAVELAAWELDSERSRDDELAHNTFGSAP